MEQLAFADVILLNKTDLIKEEDKARIMQRIKVGVPASPLLCSTPYVSRIERELEAYPA